MSKGKGALLSGLQGRRNTIELAWGRHSFPRSIMARMAGFKLHRDVLRLLFVLSCCSLSCWGYLAAPPFLRQVVVSKMPLQKILPCLPRRQGRLNSQTAMCTQKSSGQVSSLYDLSSELMEAVKQEDYTRAAKLSEYVCNLAALCMIFLRLFANAISAYHGLKFKCMFLRHLDVSPTILISFLFPLSHTLLSTRGRNQIAASTRSGCVCAGFSCIRA